AGELPASVDAPADRCGDEGGNGLPVPAFGGAPASPDRPYVDQMADALEIEPAEFRARLDAMMGAGGNTGGNGLPAPRPHQDANVMPVLLRPAVTSCNVPVGAGGYAGFMPPTLAPTLTPQRRAGYPDRDSGDELDYELDFSKDDRASVGTVRRGHRERRPSQWYPGGDYVLDPNDPHNKEMDRDLAKAPVLGTRQPWKTAGWPLQGHVFTAEGVMNFTPEQVAGLLRFQLAGAFPKLPAHVTSTWGMSSWCRAALQHVRCVAAAGKETGKGGHMEVRRLVPTAAGEYNFTTEHTDSLGGQWRYLGTAIMAVTKSGKLIPAHGAYVAMRYHLPHWGNERDVEVRLEHGGILVAHPAAHEGTGALAGYRHQAVLCVDPSAFCAADGSDDPVVAVVAAIYFGTMPMKEVNIKAGDATWQAKLDTLDDHIPVCREVPGGADAVVKFVGSPDGVTTGGHDIGEARLAHHEAVEARIGVKIFTGWFPTGLLRAIEFMDPDAKRGAAEIVRNVANMFAAFAADKRAAEREKGTDDTESGDEAATDRLQAKRKRRREEV
ncbi:hypothetical protein Rsub_12765, partial [Raphidocelis subcapitata]